MKHSRKFRIQVLLLGVSLVPFIAGISTYSAVKGNAGGPALVYDMRESAAAHRAYFEAATMDAKGATSAIATLKPLASNTCTLAQREGSEGVLTGAPGKKGVYAAYITVCEGIGTIVETLQETLDANVDRRERASQILSQLEAIPNDTNKSVFERKADFRLKANALYRIVEEAGAENLSKRLSAQIAVLEASIITLGVSDSRFGKKQASVIDSLKASVRQVGKIISGLIGANGSEPPQSPPPLLDTGKAVAAHWDKTIVPILIAILGDTMAIWFTAYLMVVTARLDALRRSHRARLARLNRGNSQTVQT